MIYTYVLKGKKDGKWHTGFTLIELLVVMVIIVILASVILYSAIQYIDKGKDAAIKGYLAVLVAAGEVWYDKSNSSYDGFCDSAAVIKALDETPTVVGDEKCNINSQKTAWAVCSREFANNTKAYCVDSKGNQKEIDNSYCNSSITNCCVGVTTYCIP